MSDIVVENFITGNLLSLICTKMPLLLITRQQCTPKQMLTFTFHEMHELLLKPT